MSIFKVISSLLIAGSLTACGGGGGNASTPTTSIPPTTTASDSIASILLTAPSPQTLNADGTSSILLTVRALNASSALVKEAVINLESTGNSILDKSVVTTDATTGISTVTLTADPGHQETRIATVKATCGSCSASAATLPIQINGATLTLASSGGTTLTAGGNTVLLTATVKSAAGVALAGIPVSFASTDGGTVSLSGATSATDPSGVATAVVSGVTSNVLAIPVTVMALGNAKSLAFTVNAAVGALSVTTIPVGDLTVITNVGKSVIVSAPGASTINFASTLGSFSPVSIAGASGASTLTVTQAGTASVDVTDNLGRRATIKLNVSPPWQDANRLILSANTTTVKLATGTTTPSIRLTARALKSVGASDQGVANVPVLFHMVGGPADGEFLTPAYQLTDGSGYAYADFYSGRSASSQNGIVVSAATQGTTVAVSTGVAPSSNSAALTISGQALSVAFGPSTQLKSSDNNTMYIQDYSAQVTDAANNPVPNALVTLQVRPVAFSTGGNCTITNTYCSEDANGNGSLDQNEDGVRVATTPTTTSQCPSTANLPVASGTLDGQLTPQNTVGGAVPATVTTDSTGAASFSLTYLKASAIWVVDKMSATVSVNGTESGSSTIFQLPATTVDGTPGATTCHLPDSPFNF